jgi:hypothetical protein
MQHSWFLCFAVAPLLTACVSDQNFHMDQDVPAPIEEDTAPPVEPPPDIPVAVCSVSPNPVTPPFEEATWDGSESYDPYGLSITDYAWSLVEKPAGSAVTLPPASGNGAIRPGFVPDLAGDYVGQLIVTNEDGVSSDPCEITLESIPAENLWVEMYWELPKDDMDLHLLAPGGQLESNTDCYYANCVGGGLDWGVRGDRADDPSLDLDDITLKGPENINIEQPQAGTFTVYVHDYNGSNGWDSDADPREANDVTVNVYLNGAQVWSNTKGISGENTVTPFCTINWETGEVSPM